METGQCPIRNLKRNSQNIDISLIGQPQLAQDLVQNWLKAKDFSREIPKKIAREIQNWKNLNWLRILCRIGKARLEIVPRLPLSSQFQIWRLIAEMTPVAPVPLSLFGGNPDFRKTFYHLFQALFASNIKSLFLKEANMQLDVLQKRKQCLQIQGEGYANLT